MGILEKQFNISEVEINDEKFRDLYLRRRALGLTKESLTGYASIDKPWLKYYDEADLLEQVPTGSVYEYICENIEKGNYNEKIAIDFIRKTTYQDLIRQADSIADILYSEGIRKGDKVSLCLPSLPQTIVLFLALNKIGAIANFIDPRINALRIKDCIGKDTKMLFSIDVFNEKIGPVADELNISNRIEISAADSIPFPLNALYRAKNKPSKESKKFQKWSIFKTKKCDHCEFEKINGEDPAAIVYTSGTTGVPKGAMLTNQGLNAISVELKHTLRQIRPEDKLLDVMPPFLAYGLACGICAPLVYGMECQLVPVFKIEELDKLIVKKRPNLVIGVPNFFESLTKSSILPKDLSFIKYFIAGGDKMVVNSKNKVNAFIDEHNIQNKVIEGWGMTENHSVAVVSNFESDIKLESTGHPLSKNNVMIVDANGNELKYGEEGELCITGPSVMAGYINNPEENEKIFVYRDGIKWIQTGDIAKIDADGSLYITGRKKRMLSRPDGHNVFPNTIEEVILKHPAVDSCVVIGTKNLDGLNGTIPTAIIVLYPGFDEETIIEEIKELSDKLLPPRDQALRYYVTDALPISNVGKIDYRCLEDIYNAKITKEKQK